MKIKNDVKIQIINCIIYIYICMHAKTSKYYNNSLQNMLGTHKLIFNLAIRNGWKLFSPLKGQHTPAFVIQWITTGLNNTKTSS